MPPVWLIFKLLETILGMCCMGFHINGFLRVKTGRSYFIYCVIFSLFTMRAMSDSMAIFMGMQVVVWKEAIINSIATIVYLYVSLSTMMHAEKDFFLLYLSELEEEPPVHPFFTYSKAQSISSLIAAVIYLLHATLLLDLVFYKDKMQLPSDYQDPGMSGGGYGQLQLVVCSRSVHKHLMTYHCFRKLCGAPPRRTMRL